MKEQEIKGDLDGDSFQSPSSVETFLRCPKQWEFSYVEGIKAPPGIAMIEGSSHHSALHLNNKKKIKSGEDLGVREVADAFADDFSSRSKDCQEWNGERKNDIIARGRNMLADYMQKLAPRIRPKAAEQSFRDERTVRGVRLGGFIDLETASDIIDYKVTGRAKSVRDAAESMQLAIYAAARKKRRVGFISLVKTSEEAVLARAMPLSVRTVAAVVKGVQDAIRKGAFPMTAPSNPLCSPTYCGYWNMCRGKL